MDSKVIETEKRFKDKILDWMGSQVADNANLVREIDSINKLSQLFDGYVLSMLLLSLYPQQKGINKYIEQRNPAILIPEIGKILNYKFQELFKCDTGLNEDQIKELIKSQDFESEAFVSIIIKYSQGPIMSGSRNECESGDYDQFSNGDATGSGINNSGIMQHRHSYQNSQYSLKQKSNFYDQDKQSIGSETEIMQYGHSPIKKKSTQQAYASTSRHVKYQNRTNHLQQDEMGQSSFHNSQRSGGGNTNFNSKFSDTRTDLQDIQKENNYLREENMYLSDQLKNLEEVLQNNKDEFNAELDELDGELDAKRAEIENLEAEIERLNNGIKEYDKCFKVKEHRELLLITKLKDMRVFRDAHYSKERAIHLNIKQLTKEYELFKKNILDITALMQEQLKLQVQEVQINLKQAHEKEILKVRREIRESKIELDEQKSMYETKLRRQQEMLDMYQNQSNKTGEEKREILQLQEMLKKAQEQNDQLQVKLDQEKHLHQKHLDDKIDEIKKQHDQEVIKKLKEQKEILAQALQKKLEEQKNKIESDMKDQQIKANELEIQTLKDEHDQVVKRLNDQIEDLKSDLQLRIPIKEQRSSQRSSAVTETDMKMVEQLNKQIDQLKKELQDKEAILIQLQGDFDEFQNQNSKRLQQRKKEIDVLKEDNDKLREELEKCLKLFQQQQLKNLKQRDSMNSLGAYQRSKSQLNLMDNQQQRMSQYNQNNISTNPSTGNLINMNMNDSTQSQGTPPAEQIRLRYQQQDNSGSINQNANVTAFNSNRNSNPLPLPTFPRNTSSLPRTPNQQQSITFQRQGPFDDKSGGSGDGVISCKSVFQSLSQQLQIDEKLNFSAFERDDKQQVAPFMQHHPSSDHGGRQGNNNGHHHRHHTQSNDDDDDDEEDQNLSFFLSNESSKHRDSRVTGDESFQKNLQYGIDESNNGDSEQLSSQRNSAVRGRESSIKSRSNRSSRKNTIDY